jgi:hypothetical protein
MQFGLFNVKGLISERNSYFNINESKKNISIDQNTKHLETICKINVLSKYAPLTSINIYEALSDNVRDEILDRMFLFASSSFKNDFTYNSLMLGCQKNRKDEVIDLPKSAYVWADSDEWKLMKEVFIRDQEQIKLASKDAGISARILLGGVIGEQFRFFSNRRETFKSYFEPLKILASLSKFSYGIAGLKPETVLKIENNLKDKNSVFYLGYNMENVANYIDKSEITNQRMNRITEIKNPYYPYLYVGLYMRQVINQWSKSGFDISSDPGVLATLYNLGFNRSIPKENPLPGGTEIIVNGIVYNFGDLADQFYYSGELIDIYPIEI